MYAIELEEFNYAAVFGVAFGIYIISNIELLAREAVTFVKGWNN
jgi:hypothetical protein